MEALLSILPISDKIVDEVMTDPQLWATLDLLLKALPWVIGLSVVLGLLQYEL